MWIIYALATIASYAGLDFFIKRMAGKINDYLGIIILSLVAVLPSLITILILRFPDKKPLVTPNGLLYAALAGIALGIGTLSFLKLFDTGVELSLASPFVRIGIMVVTTTLGIYILRETITVKELIGMGFALIGLIILVIK